MGGLVHGDAEITTHALRREVLRAQDVFDALKLERLVLQTTDIGFVEFDLAPTLGVVDAHLLDDFDDGVRAAQPFSAVVRIRLERRRPPDRHRRIPRACPDASEWGHR